MKNSILFQDRIDIFIEFYKTYTFRNDIGNNYFFCCLYTCIHMIMLCSCCLPFICCICNDLSTCYSICLNQNVFTYHSRYDSPRKQKLSRKNPYTHALLILLHILPHSFSWKLHCTLKLGEMFVVYIHISQHMSTSEIIFKVMCVIHSYLPLYENKELLWVVSDYENIIRDRHFEILIFKI